MHTGAGQDRYKPEDDVEDNRALLVRVHLLQQGKADGVKEAPRYEIEEVD